VLDIASTEEVNHGNEENHTDTSTYYSVEPFPKEYVFKAFNVHASVNIIIKPFWRFLVFSKFKFPLFLIHRW